MAGSTRTPKARALGAALRAVREETAGMSQRKLALEIGRDPGLFSRWESGGRVPKPADVDQILSALGVADDRYDEIMAMAQSIDEPHWLAVNLPEQRAQLAALLDFERTATTVTDVSLSLMPGVLQTTDYIRAIMESGHVPRNEIEMRITVRIGRRELLTRSKPARLVALLGEAAIRQVIGNRQIMAAQLRYLLELMELPNVVIRIMPFSGGYHPALGGSFVLIDSDEEGSVVHIELRDTGLFLHEEKDINTYRQAADMVLRVAMSPEVSAELISSVITDMETTHDNTAFP